MYYGQQETNTLIDAVTARVYYTCIALYWAEQLQYKNIKNITFLTNSFINLICKLINLP